MTKPLNLVFFGPPGAGKSTQADLLMRRRNMVAVSTGQKLRDTIAAGTSLGHEVEAIIAEGKLIADELMNRLLREWINAIPADHGLILDGYPRTVQQAAFLDQLLAELQRPLDAAIALVLSDEEAVHRLSGRRICRIAGQPDTILHLEQQEAVDACLAAGGTLVERPDDTADAIVQRLQEYNAKTEPLLRWYADQHQLKLVHADGDPATVSAAIFAQVEQIEEHQTSW